MGRLGAVATWLSTGETVDLRVQSGSMWPSIRAGDRVRIAGLAFPELRRGDVVLRRLSGMQVVHRVWRPTAPVLTRGDAGRAFDPVLLEGDLLGRVVAIETDGRWRTVPSYPINAILGAGSVLVAALYSSLRRVLSSA
jgi:signal peptidase I